MNQMGGFRVRVAKGFVLGQILFLVYENDLQNNTCLKVLNFPNDTLLYTTFKTETAYLNIGQWILGLN